MEAGYLDEDGRVRQEDQQQQQQQQEATNWPPSPSQGPWKGEELSQLHYALPNRQQQQQQQHHHHPYQESLLSACPYQQYQQEQNQHSLPQNQPTKYSTLYGAIDPSRKIQRSPLSLQSNPNNENSYQQSEAYNIANSYGHGGYLPPIPGGNVNNPQSSPSGSSTPSCYCNFLGHPCTCSRSSRPRFPPQQSYSTSSSSSTDIDGDGFPDSVNSPTSPINQLQYPIQFQKVISPHPLTLHPSPMNVSWSQDHDGIQIASFPLEGGLAPTSFSPSHIQQQQSEGLTGHSIRLSSTTYIPSNNHTVPQPSRANQLYESVPGTTTTTTTTGGRPVQYDSIAGLSNLSTYNSQSLLTTNLTNPESISVPLVQVPPNHDFRLDYHRSADSALPQWSFRSGANANNPLINDSVAQMSLASQSKSPLMSTVQKQQQTEIHDIPGFHQQINRGSTSIASSSNSSLATTTLDGNESRNRLGTSVDRFPTEAKRWEAITNRVHSADVYFVYGALTTRIYCRPSCASKRPDRNRVIFFPFPDAPNKAEYAGFRACKRCKPRTPGTADVCVLAVGQCLRHITQAALLGESEQVDARFKKRTLKEYSIEFGVSAFHFHRTLKNVSTLTPGDYSKACHALVLQDEIGMDKKNGQSLSPNELQHRLSGWSSRRARRAVGNILPSTYSNGFPGMKMFYIYAKDTTFGNVAILYTKGVDLGNNIDNPTVPVGASASGAPSSSQGTIDGFNNVQCTVMAAILGEDALFRLKKRSSSAIEKVEQSDWLKRLVEDLAKKGLREVQMPPEVIPWIRRARVWLAVKKALEPKTRPPGKRRINSDEEDYEGEDEEPSPIKEEL